MCEKETACGLIQKWSFRILVRELIPVSGGALQGVWFTGGGDDLRVADGDVAACTLVVVAVDA